MSISENTLVAGLTGQTGAGKTTVCRAFEKEDFSIINADLVARAVVESGKPCLDEIVKSFGERVLQKNGELDRKALAEIVFTDKKALTLLNSITYPYITAEILEKIDILAKRGDRLVMLDAPTLFESGADKFCNIIVSVVANKDIRIKRITERDGITQKQAEDRINSQHTEEFFRKNSDYIIENNGSTEGLCLAAKDISDKIKDYYNNKHMNGGKL